MIHTTLQWVIRRDVGMFLTKSFMLLDHNQAENLQPDEWSYGNRFNSNHLHALGGFDAMVGLENGKTVFQIESHDPYHKMNTHP